VFGRVVKAVALGAILVRGTGSNPVARIFFLEAPDRTRRIARMFLKFVWDLAWMGEKRVAYWRD
jgi:hypothetical protein